jgi:hypothetical protein
MYGSNVGSVSGIVHVFARRPVLAATVVLAAVVVANVPKTPPPPPTPPAPAVVELAAVPEPPPYTGGGSHKNVTYECEFNKTNTAPTNLCKAQLDSVAAYLGYNGEATVNVTGSMKLVLAVRKYFTASESKFGIGPSRIHIHVDDSDGNVVLVEQVP